MKVSPWLLFHLPTFFTANCHHPTILVNCIIKLGGEGLVSLTVPHAFISFDLIMQKACIHVPPDPIHLSVLSICLPVLCNVPHHASTQIHPLPRIHPSAYTHFTAPSEKHPFPYIAPVQSSLVH